MNLCEVDDWSKDDDLCKVQEWSVNLADCSWEDRGLASGTEVGKDDLIEDIF